MPRALAFHSEALEEFEAPALWYAAIRLSLGEAFIGQVEAATTRAVRAPMTGAPLGSLRRVFVKRFLYFMLYAVEDTHVYVLAVAHFRKRPGYWRRRSQPQDGAGLSRLLPMAAGVVAGLGRSLLCERRRDSLATAPPPHSIEASAARAYVMWVTRQWRRTALGQITSDFVLHRRCRRVHRFGCESCSDVCIGLACQSRAICSTKPCSSQRQPARVIL